MSLIEADPGCLAFRNFRFWILGFSILAEAFSHFHKAARDRSRHSLLHFTEGADGAVFCADVKDSSFISIQASFI